METLHANAVALFPDPKDALQAVRQCNIMERAKTLCTTGGYDWYICSTDAYRFGVCGPKGQHYEVNMRERTCSCKGFEQDKVCKHLVALTLDPACHEASQVRHLELTAQDADNRFVCQCDRTDRLVREAGGGF